MSESREKIVQRLHKIANTESKSRHITYKVSDSQSTKELKEILNKYLERYPKYLNLHETVKLSFGIHIMKVHGGYIYDAWDDDTDTFKNGTFIPLNLEK